MEAADQCPFCQVPLGVLNTVISSDQRQRIRYLGCRCCGRRPSNNKRVIPLYMAPFQASRSRRRRQQPTA